MRLNIATEIVISILLSQNENNVLSIDELSSLPFLLSLYENGSVYYIKNMIKPTGYHHSNLIQVLNGNT
jgi:hypothetical protein